MSVNAHPKKHTLLLDLRMIFHTRLSIRLQIAAADAIQNRDN